MKMRKYIWQDGTVTSMWLMNVPEVRAVASHLKATSKFLVSYVLNVPNIAAPRIRFLTRVGKGPRHRQMPEPPKRSQRLPCSQRMETIVDILSFTLHADLPAPIGLSGTVPPVQ